MAMAFRPRPSPCSISSRYGSHALMASFPLTPEGEKSPLALMILFSWLWLPHCSPKLSAKMQTLLLSFFHFRSLLVVGTKLFPKSLDGHLQICRAGR